MADRTEPRIDGKPQWDVPGWDWEKGDYAWLSAGVEVDGTHIFFIHGGRIRHQAHVQHGHYPIDQFIGMLNDRAKGLADPYVCWSSDPGDGVASLWVEGTRPPNERDLGRLARAREAQHKTDQMALRDIAERRPDIVRAVAEELNDE